MSILIKGMEMPETCEDCEFHRYHSNREYVCIATPLFYPMNLANSKGIRKDFCPIEEVPECEDAVSRKSILDKISEKDNWEKYDRYNVGLSDARRIVQDEPSVTPKRKTGKWIVHYECPKCGEITKDFTEYCPFCFADMRGEQDDD